MLLPIHVVSASVALVSGTIALVVRKGSRLHRRSGLVFVYAMVAMCVSAVVAAIARGQTVNVIAGTLTAYLTITGLTTVHPPAAQPRVRRIVGVLLMTVACVLGLTTLMFACEAVTSPTGKSHGYPGAPFFIFASIGLLGSAGDLRVLQGRALRGAPRLARHLWRMCIAMWIAVLSFFSVRTRVAMLFPARLVSPALQFAPIVLVIVVMFYWLWRIRVRAGRLIT